MLRYLAKLPILKSRRSPLVHGGLEIPVEVTVEMSISEKNLLALKKYQTLVEESYEEPVNGKFADETAAILKALKSESDEEESEERDDSDDGDDELASCTVAAELND